MKQIGPDRAHPINGQLVAAAGVTVAELAGVDALPLELLAGPAVGIPKLPSSGGVAPAPVPAPSGPRPRPRGRRLGGRR